MNLIKILHPLLSPSAASAASPTSPTSSRLVVLLVQCNAHGYHQRNIHSWRHSYIVGLSMRQHFSPIEHFALNDSQNRSLAVGTECDGG